jgi:hypothetical protein
MFEMTAMMILDPSAPGCPVHQIKCADQFKSLFDPRRPMGVETGRAMAAWARGEGDAQKRKETMDRAREIAREGTERFKAWWQGDEGKAAREAIKPIIAELRELAQQADEAASVSDDAPFGTSPPPDNGGDSGAASDVREAA